MKVKDPGHRYELRVLDGPFGEEHVTLRFVKRDNPPEKYPGNVGHYAGTTTQEVLRALIDRTKYVNNQMPADENKRVLYHLREAIWWLESRAARVHSRQLKALPTEIELKPTCPKCGHLECKEHDAASH